MKFWLAFILLREVDKNVKAGKFLEKGLKRVPLIVDGVFEPISESVEYVKLWLSIQNHFQANERRTITQGRSRTRKKANLAVNQVFYDN